MNTLELTDWKTFRKGLEQNPELSLHFQYARGQRVDASYHITEIKQASITSVDCGGVINSWKEIIIQLWEPTVKENDTAMSVHKALSIIELVKRSMPLDNEAIVKIEFGNSDFDTRQMYPSELLVEGNNLVVNLTPDFTQCKAIVRGGSCGTSETEECCTPAKPQVKIKNLLISDACCTPGTGCC